MRLAAAFVLGLALPPAAGAGDTPWWVLPREQLEALDLRNPHVATSQDLAALQAGVATCRALLALPAGTESTEAVPAYCQAWAVGQASWWRRIGSWYYAEGEAVLRPPVLLIGPVTSGGAADFAVQAAGEVSEFLRSNFGLPSPKYARLVRFFDRWDELPQPIAQAFGEHHGFASVSGLTLSPRFVIIPTHLRGRGWASRDQVLVGRGGTVVSRVALHDLLVHELVHAHVHALVAEAAEERGEDALEAHLPVWLDEGLAVYLTEKLLIEPGSKPVSYYEYSAPLHYLAEDWGEEELREFVRTAVLDSYPRALRQLGMSEEGLRRHGKEYLKRRPGFRRAARSYGYIVVFLAALVALAALPFLVSLAWNAAKAPLKPASREELLGLWLDVQYALGSREERRTARRFLRRLRRAPAPLRHELGWRRCKLFLLTGV